MRYDFGYDNDIASVDERGDIYVGIEPCDCQSQNHIGELISGSYKRGADG